MRRAVYPAYNQAQRKHIFVYQKPISAQFTEQILSISVSAGGSLLQPVKSMGSIRTDSQTVQITATEPKLSIAVITLCCGPIFFHILRHIRYFLNSGSLPQRRGSTHIQPTGSSQTSYQQCSAAQSFPAEVLLFLHTCGRCYPCSCRIASPFADKFSNHLIMKHLPTSHS